MRKNKPIIGIPCWQERSQKFGNLPSYSINQRYIHAVYQAGAVPIIIPTHQTSDRLQPILYQIDGLLLVGGEDIDPQNYIDGNITNQHCLMVDSDRDYTELTLAKIAIDRGIPIMGICRGMQILNVACGGTLYQDLTNQEFNLNKHDYFFPTYQRNRLSHSIQIDANSFVGRLFGTVSTVNSLHHQGIKRLGENLHASAYSDDGLIEAIEIPSHPFALGVQWHPEELVDIVPANEHLFKEFVLAINHRARTMVQSAKGVIFDCTP